MEEKEIFIKIWTSPRTVFKYLNDNNYKSHVNLLLTLGGITSAFNKASIDTLGDNMSLFVVFGLCVIFGAPFGWVSYYLYAGVLRLTGKWLNGKGDSNSILTILSYASIPAIATLGLILIQISFFGESVFQSNFYDYSGGIVSTVLFLVTTILELLLGFWTIVLIVIGLTVVQKFSILKAILNMILPALVLFFTLGVIAFILGDLFG